jgi:hypothetical protein
VAKAPIEIRSLARTHTESALKVLAGIMNETSCPPAARVSAASALLDRGWGKPVQSMEHSGHDGGPIETLSQDPVAVSRAVVDFLRGSKD